MTLKPPIIVGVVIAAVILVAGLLAPRLRSGAAKTADAARARAALAERMLARYDFGLPGFERSAATGKLKQAELEPLLGQVQQSLRELSQQWSRELGQMQNSAEAAGLRPPAVQPATPDLGGLRRALEQYDAALQSNAELLARAAQEAKGALSQGAGVLGVAQVSGMAEYARAAGLLAEAEVLRGQQRLLQARLLLLAGQWKAYRAQQDYLAGLDVRDLLGRLRADREEVRQLEAEATERAGALAAQVSEREQALAEAERELAAARAELLDVEQRGFTAGDDPSFLAYRDKYVALSTRLRQLAEEEELLRLGGRKGAQFVGDDLTTAELEGGAEVVGLEALRAEWARAQEVVRRLGGAVESLEKHIRFVEQAGQAAKQGEDRYAELQQELTARQKELLSQLPKLAGEAADKETQALGAAREAVSAFAGAQQAAERWVSGAREVRSARDPNNKNPRLSMMVGNRTVPLIGDSALAATHVLVGRIYAQRIEANQALIDDMNRFIEMCPGPEFKPDVFQEQITTARDSGIEALKKAEDLCKRLAGKAPENARWIPQAGLATVYHLLARVNVTESASLLASAVEAADQAVTGRERSPYLPEHVRFRDHLRALAGGGEPAAGDSPEKEETGG